MFSVKFLGSKVLIGLFAAAFVIGGGYSVWRQKSGAAPLAESSGFKLVAEIPINKKTAEVPPKKQVAAIIENTVLTRQHIPKVAEAPAAPSASEPVPVILTQPKAEEGSQDSSAPPTGQAGPPQNDNVQPVPEPPVASEAEPDPAPEPALPPASEPEPEKVFIVEIMFDAVGADSGKEFIKLFNPTNSDINMENWSLKNGGTSLIKIGSKPEDALVIKAQSYFTVGFYGNTNAEITRSAQLPNGVAVITLFNDEAGSVDQASYDGALFEDGVSWQK